MTTTGKKLTMIICAAAIVRLLLVVAFKTYEHPVTWEYERIINNILAGKGFVYDFMMTTYRSFNNPLYSYLCAGIYAVTAHSFAAVLAMQSIFSLLLIYAVFGIGRYMFNDTVGLLAALFTALHPGLIYYDVFNLIPLSIDTFLIAAATILFLRAKDKGASWRIFLVGALIGLGCLSRGIIGALLPLIGAYTLLIMRKLTIRERLKVVALLAVGTFLVLGPWLIRNYVIHKELLIISTTGETLWRGNNEHAVGTSLDKDGKTMLDLYPEEFRRRIYSMNEIEQKHFFEKEALSYIRSNPVAFAQRYIKKLYYFWWFSPQSGLLYKKAYLYLYQSLYAPFLLFFIYGMICALGNTDCRDNALLLVFVFTAICLLQSVFYVEGRHKWLIEPLMAIFAGYGMLEACSNTLAHAQYSIKRRGVSDDR